MKKSKLKQQLDDFNSALSALAARVKDIENSNKSKDIGVLDQISPELKNLKTVKLTSEYICDIVKIPKENLEAGKWYKQDKPYAGVSQYLICVTEQDDLGVIGYGICEGVWFTNGNAYFKDLILATTKEVEEALINEAKRRGFKEGVKFKSAATGNEFKLKGNISFNKEYNILQPDKGCIFENGKWAEIV